MAFARSPMYPWPTHLEACRLHDNETSPTCAGYLRRGNIQCIKKATAHVIGAMPTCKQHGDQLKTASHCRVFLPCGFECARLCEWIPMGSQRCEMHAEVRGTCYFLERLPIELRVRIYGYLLPSKEILAKSDDLDAFGLPSDRIISFGRKGIFMAICRLNRQIHDEATSFLYGSSNFSIWLEERGIRMCNSLPTAPPTSLPGAKSNHQLQDYQMQLMLLEQQNKKRLLMARQDHDRHVSSTVAAAMQTHASTWNARCGASVNMSPLPAIVSSGNGRANTKAINYYTPAPQGATWEPPLVPWYFNLIQSFRITVSFVDSTPHPRPMRINRNVEEISSEDMLYMYTDQLHRIVSRLQATHRPIYRLEVTIRFEKQRNMNEDFKTIQLLLRPFKRLYGVQNATVICWNGADDPYGSEIRKRQDEIDPYLALWKREVEGGKPSQVPGKEWEAYWGLEKLMTNIAGHCQGKKIGSGLSVRLTGFTELRHKARIAREENEEERLKTYVVEVTETWWDFVEWERRIQMGIGGEIDELWRLVGGAGAGAGAGGEVGEGSKRDVMME